MQRSAGMRVSCPLACEAGEAPPALHALGAFAHPCAAG
jgi:hypothetical protein